MAAPAAAGKQGVFTRKLGPLPAWAWIAIVAGVIVLWAWWQSRKNPAAATPAAGVTPPVIDQFTLTTPPAQDEDTGDDDDSSTPTTPKPGPHPKIPPRKPPHGGGTGGHKPHGRPGGEKMEPPHTKPKPVRGVFRKKKKRPHIGTGGPPTRQGGPRMSPGG
jgi:hypothetical protein